MNVPEILNKWAEYSKYDPEQKKFNLLSGNYMMHRASENAKKIFEYDQSGQIAVLYLKTAFRDLCKDSVFKVIDVMENPDCITEHKTMWDIFHSADVDAIENEILGAMDAIIQKIVPVKQIGERNKDAERDVLAESVTGVVEELTKCHVDLFLKSGRIGHIKNFSTEIYVFDTLSQCLLTMESAPDAMYVCYIRNRDTADGYFQFIIKSNGNLLSVNERINEAYPGQHKNSRNGRWADSKAFQIFPYSLMKDIGEWDYLGYAHHYSIDESELKLFNLGPKTYMPLVLAMVMLSLKYSDCDVSGYAVKYVDAMLPHNLELAAKGEETSLIIPENSALVAAHKGYINELTTEEVLTGSAGSKFDHQALRNAGIEKPYYAQGTFPSKPNIFVELYGKGFQLDSDALLEKDHHLRLPSTMDRVWEDVTPNFEFVGDKDTLDLIAYRAARLQLSEYVRDKMFEEYISFGGVAAVRKWFMEQIELHKDEILRICAEAFAEAEAKKETMGYGVYQSYGSELILRKSGYRVSFDYEKTGVRAYGNGIDMPFNNVRLHNGRGHDRWACAVDSTTKATYNCHIIFPDWTDMARLFGEENIPKIVKGYNFYGHDYSGNNLLDCVDYMDAVGTPFEEREYNHNPRYWTKDKYWDYYFHSGEPGWHDKEIPENALKTKPVNSFHVTVALSKRGINRLLAGQV